MGRVSSAKAVAAAATAVTSPATAATTDKNQTQALKASLPADRAARRNKELLRISSFRRSVYELVRNVPPGKVTTYGALARALSCGSAQAIGQAMRHNPYAQFYYQAPYPAEMVPCHRVVASDLTIGGFSGQKDISSQEICNKVELLKEEGVATVKVGGKIKLANPGVVLQSLPAVKNKKSS